MDLRRSRSPRVEMSIPSIHVDPDESLSKGRANKDKIVAEKFKSR